MPDGVEWELEEARGVISGTNTTIVLLAIAGLFWWIANLFPVNLSERTFGDPEARLSELKDLSQRAAYICRQSLIQYTSDTYGAIKQGNAACLSTINRSVISSRDMTFPAEIFDAAPQSFQALVDRYQRRNFRKILDDVDDELAEIAKRDDCRESIKQWRAAHLDRCITLQGKLDTYVTELTKQGSLELLGLKINNIHIKWHPLVLVLILTLGVVWLGFRRRRVLWLLDAYFVRLTSAPPAEPNGVTADQNSAPALSNKSPAGQSLNSPPLDAIPWWLLPIPNWQYGNVHFRSMVAPFKAGEPRFYALLALLTSFTMMVSALVYQQKISRVVISPTQSDLAGLLNSSFSITNSPYIDVFLQAILFIGAVALLFVIIPVRRAVPNVPWMDRRQFCVAGFQSVGIVALVSLVPFVLDPQQFARAVNLTRKRFASKGKPRFRQKPILARVSALPGWYRNESRSQHSGVSHFVKDAYSLSRRPKRGPKRLQREIALPSGRIKGAGRLSESNLVMLTAEQIATGAPSSLRFNQKFYSEGIEYEALRAYRNGQKEQAIQILMAGLVLARQQRPLNIRLYDLTAGLLIRSDRINDLAELKKDVRAEVESLQKTQKLFEEFRSRSSVGQMRVQQRGRRKSRAKAPKRDVSLRNRISMLQTRLDLWEKPKRNWNKPPQKWRNGWRPNAGRKWNGVDI